MFESVFVVSLIPTDPVRRMQLNYPSVPPEFLHGSRSVKSNCDSKLGPNGGGETCTGTRGGTDMMMSSV